MPIYEYQCASCGHQLEVLQKMSETPLSECPNCHKTTLNKLVSATSFQLKGTGWYVTDFRDKGKPKSSPSSKEGEGATSGSDNKKEGDTSAKPGESSSEAKSKDGTGT